MAESNEGEAGSAQTLGEHQLECAGHDGFWIKDSFLILASTVELIPLLLESWYRHINRIYYQVAIIYFSIFSVCTRVCNFSLLKLCQFDTMSKEKLVVGEFPQPPTLAL